jgi:hypothetical protein
MKLSKVISKTLRHEGKAAQVAGRIDAAIAANVNEPGTTTRSRTKTRRRIVQRSGRTVVSQQRTGNDES